MNGKRRLAVGVIVLVVFGVLGLMNFKNSLAPYVTFAEAREAGRTVQVAGFPVHSDADFDAAAGGFRFVMHDEFGEKMDVLYRGGKPGNFDQAQSVVVVGNYDGKVMEAKQILVKCPSKYEAMGDTHPGEGGEDQALPESDSGASE